MTSMHPQTGELVDLGNTLDSQLAEWLDGIEELQSKLKAFKDDINVELLNRMDLEANWDAREAGDFIVSADKPGISRDWKAKETIENLQSILSDMETQGMISHAARMDAIEPTVRYVAKHTKVRDIARANPEMHDMIYGAVVTTERYRKVRVQPKESR